jgi:Spermine/spermidine synthase domain
MRGPVQGYSGVVSSEEATPAGRRLRLIGLSFLMLFVELALIRWLGSNVVYLSYFSNFVLLGSFLGIGLGFLSVNRKRDLFPWAPAVLAALILFVHLLPVRIDRTGSELLYFGEFERTGLPVWITLPIVFIAVAAVMGLIAHGVARTFITFAPLEAYRLDVLGSIVGIAAFSALSFLRAPPVVWGLVAAGTFALLLGFRLRLVPLIPLVAMVLALGFESAAPLDTWSPYYKVTVTPVDDGSSVYRVDVNGIPHQMIEPTVLRARRERIYFRPYELAAVTDPPTNVLVIGAGNGTDVAIALDQGAGHVDAVEIDPRLYEVGRDLHPDRPYSDPRVSVHIEDGRAFLERTDDRYDLILFALPDSLTLVSGQASLRLESYLFTREAMAEARSHLEPDGVFALYNYFREEWLVDRLAGLLDETYGHPPCLDTAGRERRGLALLTASLDASGVNCDRRWDALGTDVPEPPTDDYPFVYLRTRSLPSLYVVTLALILGSSLLLTRAVAGPFRRMAPYVDLFFMGAAFLLLETKSVVQFALLFGTTWFVNALVFAGILLSVLAAVEVARHRQVKRPLLVYGALLASLAVAYAVPARWLLNLPTAPRFVLAVALAFTPIFLANIVFAERFRRVGSSAVGFGANLLGAMVGGVLEYASLVIGYRQLLLIVAGLYGLAFLLGRGQLRAYVSSPT